MGCRGWADFNCGDRGIIVFNRVSYSPTEPIAINSPKQEPATAKQTKDQQPRTGAAVQEPWRSLLSIRVAELKSNIDELRASGYLLRTMNGYVVVASNIMPPSGI
jgi:hypothetical protein